MCRQQFRNVQCDWLPMATIKSIQCYSTIKHLFSDTENRLNKLHCVWNKWTAAILRYTSNLFWVIMKMDQTKEMRIKSNTWKGGNKWFTIVVNTENPLVWNSCSQSSFFTFECFGWKLTVREKANDLNCLQEGAGEPKDEKKKSEAQV